VWCPVRPRAPAGTSPPPRSSPPATPGRQLWAGSG
jgi:hypothetical protein